MQDNFGVQPLNSGQLQELRHHMIVVVGILRDNPQQIVGFAREGIALEHMVDLDDRLLKGS